MNTRPIFGLWAIIVGVVLCAIGLWIILKPTEYQATVKIEIGPSPAHEIDSNGVVYVPYVPSYDPYFIETEFQAMVSDAVLSKVVETLDLNTEWGKRYGRTLETAEAIKLLRPQIDISVRQNTKIVEIRVSDEDPNEAAQIANAIAEAYKNYRVSRRDQEMAEGIKMLEEDYVKEEAKISLMQSNLDLLREQLHIDDTNNLNNAAPPPILNEQQQHLKELLAEDEAEYMKLENEFTELQTIRATNPAALREVLPTMTSDDMLRDMLGKLDDNMQKLAAETNGVGGTSSDRASVQASIADLDKQIDSRVNGIMITLKTKVDGAEAALDTLSNRLMHLEAGGGPYWDAKWDLDSERNTCELLKAKIEFDKKDDSIPKTLPVVIIDPAVPPKSPSGPGRKLGAGLFIGGLAISGFGINSFRGATKREESRPKSV